MVSGLLMEPEDHNSWTIAEAAGHRGPHRLQHFLSRAVWDDQRVADLVSAWAVSHLDDGDGVLIFNETADEKSSGTAAGAARQYSGTVGGVALCQVAVTLTYATGRGHTPIGRALYLPEACAADEEHRGRPARKKHDSLGHPKIIFSVNLSSPQFERERVATFTAIQQVLSAGHGGQHWLYEQ
ncbi:MAG TPA: transposase [Streptosporangiaceae bacterium]|nr:transposase [Streptosporangiaceae bacterium]